MAAVETKEFKVFGLRMWQQVALALVLGVLVGYVAGEDAAGLKALGDIFIKLIKMVVAPLIFFALISGITSLNEGRHLRGLALKGTAAYLVTAIIAVMIGLTLGTLVEPGAGVALPSGKAEVLAPLAAAPPPTAKDFILNLVPTNIVGAMAGEVYLHIVIFAIFTGIVINALGGKAALVKQICQESAQIVFRMIEWIVRLAPLAVFGFMAFMVGTTGKKAILDLVELSALVIAACFLQYAVLGVLISVFARLSPFPFYRKMITTQLMAFSTSSSKATLTTAMRELEEKLGVSAGTVNFMMPLGASINMDGTAIYLGICAMFFAQMYGIPMGTHEYLILLLTCTLGSIGAAGIPSGSIIFMGMVLTSVGIPMEGIGIILGVDRILDMFRTTVNITGDATITLIMDKTEGTLDTEAYHR